MLITKANLDIMLKQYQDLVDEIERLSATAEAIKEGIKQYMGEEEEIVAEDFIVRWTRFEQSRFNTSAFKQVHGDLYEAFTSKTPTSRFTVKRIN